MKKEFSVIVAVAPDRGAEVLKSLKDVDYPEKRFEIIVERGLNASENRNLGARRATGEIFAFIDDDAIVDREILTKAEEFFQKNKEIDIVGGPQLTPNDDNHFAKISGYALSSIFGAWKMTKRYSGKKTNLNADETMLTSANLFCRRRVLDRIKFDTALWPGEDSKFISDSKKEGFGVAYSREIIVFHRRRNSFSGIIKQIYSYGKTRPQKEILLETLKRPFFIMPSLFLAYLVLLLLSSSIFLVAGFYKLVILFSIPLITYALLNIFFSLFNAIIKKDILAFFILPLLYATIHVSYGYGFIIGMLKK